TDTGTSATSGSGTTETTSTTTTPATTTDTTSTSTSTSTTTTPSVFTPTISADQADYAPGSIVTLTGSGWGPGEGVHVFVNDDIGQTWSYSTDVVADTAGSFVVHVQLPATFIATYSVIATGATSGTATTSFTDGNISIQLATADDAANGVAGFTWSVNWSQWQGNNQNPNNDCHSAPNQPTLHTTTYTVNSVDNGNNPAPQANNNASAKITGAQATITSLRNTRLRI